MSPSRDSRATQELIRLLDQEGIEMSPRRIERWSEEGPIPEADRRRNGRKGTEAILAPHTLEYVREAVAIQKAHRPLHHVALIMFLRGREIAFDKLRAAFLKRLAELEKELKRLTKDKAFMDAAEQAAEKMVTSLHKTKEGRAMLSRLNAYRESMEEDARESVEALARSVHTNLFRMAYGVEVGDEAIREIVEASGLASMEKVISGIGPVTTQVQASDIRQAAELASLATRREAIETTSHDDLRLAAILVRLLAKMATEFSLYCKRAGLDRDAFGFIVFADRTELDLVDYVPIFALKLQDERWRKNALRHLEWLEVALPQYQSINEVVGQLPRRYWKWLRPDKEDWLEVVPEIELEKLQALLDSIFEKRPDLRVVENQEIWDKLDELQSRIEDID